MRLLFFAMINHGSNHVRNDYPKHAQKPLFSRLQNPDGIVTPPLPLNAVVAQRGASVGIPHKYYGQRKSGGGDKKSSLLGRQASQTAFRLPLKRENPCPFWVCRKKAGVICARHSTSDGQCPPKNRNLQYLQIEVKIRRREKSWSQIVKKLQLSPIIWEI